MSKKTLPDGLEKALTDSYLKYSRVIEKFPRKKMSDPKWFYKYCWGDTCALCAWKRKTYPKASTCAKCPLSAGNDEGPECCAEWQAARGADLYGELTIAHLEAIQNRIGREMTKRGIPIPDES